MLKDGVCVDLEKEILLLWNTKILRKKINKMTPLYVTVKGVRSVMLVHDFHPLCLSYR
jgi:hypothetical protein